MDEWVVWAAFALLIVISLIVGSIRGGRNHRAFIKLADQHGYAYHPFDKTTVHSNQTKNESVDVRDRLMRFSAFRGQADSIPVTSVYEGLKPLGFHLFSQGMSHRVTYVFELPFEGGEMKIFQFYFSTHGRPQKRRFHHHVVTIEGNDLPQRSFFARRRLFLTKRQNKVGGIEFDMSPEFTDKFKVTGKPEEEIKMLFTPLVVDWFYQLPDSSYRVETKPHRVLIYGRGKLTPDRFHQLKEMGEGLHALLSTH
ncbi:MAG: hypothetical protein AAF633_15710 [Chloroflexota bacterium]